jgi:hypothetical protein
VREFWVASGHHLARLTPDGWLGVTDELLLAWLARPEVVPPPEACDAERALHGRLIADPRAAVDTRDIAALSDPDARENWEFLVGFRDRLVAAGTVEAAYLAAVREGAVLPPVFLNHLVQLILRNALDGCGDPFTLRAAELFFRAQRATVEDGAVLLADLELAEELEAERHASPLTAMFNEGSLDTLSEANAWTYWSRSDAHAMRLNFGGDARARAGLAAAVAAFVRHLLGEEVAVAALTDVAEPDLRWFVGLDAEATAIGNALWRGEAPEAADRLIGLFRLDFADPRAVLPRAAGHPVYLLMAMAADGTVRLKPQNLVVGLPLGAAVVS